MMSRIALVAAVGLSLFALTLHHPMEARAGVHVNIGVNLPAFVFPAPPPVVVIPGTYVYYASGVDLDILFYHGYWYRPHGDRWFRARSYNGPWVYIESGRVPGPLVRLPHDYRRVRHAYKAVPYGQLKKNWRTWERERHWERVELSHEMERPEPMGRGHREWEHGRGEHKGR